MNILLTCAGRRNYIVDYFREALARENGNVYAANSTADSTALIVADKSFIVPSLNDPEYIDVLIGVCQKYNVEAIIPLFDLELPVLANAQKRFAEAGIRAVVSSSDVIEICNDKWKTREFIINHGLNTPKTFIDLNDAIEAIEKYEVSYPLIIKPRWGMGSIGLFEAEDEKELIVLYHKAQRIIEKSYLVNESHKDIEKCVLIQEKLLGQEYGLDVINDLDGKYVTTFVKKKISMRSGETDGAETVDRPELRQSGELIGRQLGHIANLDMDVFLNDSGTFILEMNPRFGGGYPFSHLAGADLPSAIIAWLRNEPADPDSLKIAYKVRGYKGIIPMIARNDLLNL